MAAAAASSLEAWPVRRDMRPLWTGRRTLRISGSAPRGALRGGLHGDEQLVCPADVRAHERLRELAVTRLQRTQDLPVFLRGLSFALRQRARAFAVDTQQVIHVAAQHLDDAIVAAA